jgi:non-homologous end joining protein Ku
VPDGKVGEHPFGLMREGMIKENRYAVAEVVMFGKEQIVLRPAGSLVAMFALDYDFQVKKPAEFGGCRELTPTLAIMKPFRR